MVQSGQAVPPLGRVVIIGAGIGGLATALWLNGSGAEITIIERDPEPPEIAPEEAFEQWARPGVPQFRHAHILLARMQTALRDHHPEVLEQVRAAGVELSSLQDALPGSHLASLQPQEGDEDLRHLWGRRATFEYVMRRHVGTLPNVRFIHSARVEGLITESDGKRLRVHGVEYSRGDVRERLPADVVVDASGKRSKAPEWLQARGVRVEVERHPSEFVYACRHYRLNDPAAAPPRRDGAGSLDYLGYATFYAEHGNYALTFGCPVEERELGAVMRRTEGFEALTQQFPVLRQWTQQSVATTKVLGSGAFENRWTHYGGRGGLRLHGFFALGDSHLETNPMYGRGCSAAFIQAQALADTLAATSDPDARARRYYTRTRALLRPTFDLSVGTDRMFHMRAGLRRGDRLPLGARVLNYLYEAAWIPANYESVLVAREFAKAQQMREISSLGLRLRMSWHILRSLFRTWLRGTPSPFLPVVPQHAEFLRRLPAGNPQPDTSSSSGGSAPVDQAPA